MYIEERRVTGFQSICMSVFNIRAVINQASPSLLAPAFAILIPKLCAFSNRKIKPEKRSGVADRY